MTVDSFKYLPRLISVIYESTEVSREASIPWTPIDRPLSQSKLGLVTTAGLYQPGLDPPFDLERERQEPTWGDPSYRSIPNSITQDAIGVSHLHINNEPILLDFNILLPIERMKELAEEGRIKGLAEEHYSFMGYQGYPPNTKAWKEVYGPEIAEKFKSQGVNCVLLTPS